MTKPLFEKTISALRQQADIVAGMQDVTKRSESANDELCAAAHLLQEAAFTIESAERIIRDLTIQNVKLVHQVERLRALLDEDRKTIH